MTRDTQMEEHLRHALGAGNKARHLSFILMISGNLVLFAIIVFLLNSTDKEEHPVVASEKTVETGVPRIVKKKGKVIVPHSSRRKPAMKILNSDWRKDFRGRPLLYRTIQLNDNKWHLLPLPRSVAGEIKFGWRPDDTGILFYAFSHHKNATSQAYLQKHKIYARKASHHVRVRLIGKSPFKLTYIFAPAGFSKKTSQTKPQDNSSRSMTLARKQHHSRGGLNSKRPGLQVISSKWRTNSNKQAVQVTTFRLNDDKWHDLPKLQSDVTGWLVFNYDKTKGYLYLEMWSFVRGRGEIVVPGKKYRWHDTLGQVRKIGKDQFLVSCTFVPSD